MNVDNIHINLREDQKPAPQSEVPMTVSQLEEIQRDLEALDAKLRPFWNQPVTSILWYKIGFMLQDLRSEIPNRRDRERKL